MGVRQRSNYWDYTHNQIMDIILAVWQSFWEQDYNNPGSYHP